MNVTLIQDEGKRSADEARADPGPPRTVLVTGAAGRIGRDLARTAAETGRYRLRLMAMDEPQREHVEGHGEVVVGNMLDNAFLRRCVEGVDTVMHLAANPSPRATWEELTGPNVEAVVRLLEAARDAGCRRVVLLSSINAVFKVPRDRWPFDEETGVAPKNLYGATKAFAEAAGRALIEQTDMSVLCIRLGGAAELEAMKGERIGFSQKTRCAIAMPDVSDLLMRCIDDERVRYGVFNATSVVDDPALDLSRAEAVLGWRPRYRLTDEGFALLEADTATA